MLLTLSTQHAEQGLCNGRASIRPSVCLSHRSIAAAAAGRLAARAPCGQEISIDSCGRRATGAGAQQQMRAAASRPDPRRRVNTDLLPERSCHTLMLTSFCPISHCTASLLLLLLLLRMRLHAASLNCYFVINASERADIYSGCESKI